MSRLFALLAGWRGYAAVAALCLVMGASGTWRVMSWHEQAQVARQAVATLHRVEAQTDIETRLNAIYLPELVFVQTETKRRETEIPKHVTPAIDRQYPVPLGFVRVFNDAAHGPVPPAAAGSDAEPSGVPLSDVAQAHTADEGTLDLCRKQLREWWDWYDQNKAAWSK